MRRALFVAGLMIACNHTPEEPVHISPDPSTKVAAPTKPAPRCIKTTPDTPPPAVAPAKTCPKDPLGGPPKAQVVSLGFVGAANAPKLEAEVARSPDETERGLMFRTSMPADHGMVFLMGAHDEHTFWMRNTCIPLDMLFVDSDGTIVGILENVPTLNEDPRTVGCASNYVVETNAGWCRSHGVKAGQKIALPTL
jgi:uncharacterized membrane protein (UPF0127 family)